MLGRWADAGTGRQAGRHLTVRPGPFLEVLMLTAVMVVFNLYPDRVGYLQNATRPGSFVPVLLGASFTELLPWLNVWWSVALVAAVLKLARADQRSLLAWVELSASVLGVFLLGRLLLGPAPVSVDTQWAAAADPALVTSARQFMPWLATLVDAGLAFGLVACAIAAGRRLRSLLGRELWKTMVVGMVILGGMLLQSSQWNLLLGVSVALAMAAGLAIGLARATRLAHVAAESDGRV